MDRHPRHTCASDFGISDRTIVDGFDGVRFVMAVPGHSLDFCFLGDTSNFIHKTTRRQTFELGTTQL